ncbi:MAG: DegV family protein [Anaerolineae bacterium]
MSSIAIVTDTDASLPPTVAEAYGIRLVPINIHFGDRTYQTGVDIDDAMLLRMVKESGTLPTTSAPTPGQFAEAYSAAFEAGCDAVVCLCVSSEVSGTYNAALSASELLPGKDITVVDSRTISMGQGYMAIEAAKAAQEGASIDDVIARSERVRARTVVYAALDTLRYLALSGRVGHLAAGMASLLQVKPILTLQAGKLDLLERVRTRRKAWDRLIRLFIKDLDGRGVEEVAILHVGAEELAREFEDQLRSSLGYGVEAMMTEFTPGLSVHTGAGMVGAVIVAAPGA